MADYGQLVFWPVIVLIGVIVIALSARFLVRLAIGIIAIILIWYCFAYVGLVPPPTDFFKSYSVPLPKAVTSVIDSSPHRLSVKK